MCGILGRVGKYPSGDLFKLINVSAAMSHRGPDSEGAYFSNCGRVGFVHKRLAIVDLSSSGHQPMSSSCGRYTVTFNGEIYNYEELKSELAADGVCFNGRSDTEVLLAGYIRWGEDVLLRLNGPFAFAIHDCHAQSVFVARDRVGEKPLFLMVKDSEFYFSSDQRTLMSLLGGHPRFNDLSLLSYLSRGYPMQGNSLIDGITSLKSGHCITYSIETGEMKVRQYWKPKYNSNFYPSDKSEILNELHLLLKDSLRLQLHCDVPACILLSGGVDSSLITALASEISSNLKTFTVKFSGNSSFNEADRARLISEYFSTNHTEIEGGEISPLLFERVAAGIDSPINDSSLLPTCLVYESVASVCKVALGGDGGDELFGGYKHYSRLLKLEQYFGPVLPLIPGWMGSSLKALIPKNYRLRNWAMTSSLDLNFQIPNIREIMDYGYVCKLLQFDFDKYQTQFEADWKFISSGSGSVLSNAINADLLGYFSESILVKSDRCSMLNSVESRSPFLDSRIVDFATERIPDSLKTTLNDRKILLKEIGHSALPKTFDFERKLGFNLPLVDLIRKKEWKIYLKALFASDYTFLNRSFCMSLLDEHLAGKNHADKIFGIALLIRWAQVNNIHAN